MEKIKKSQAINQKLKNSIEIREDDGTWKNIGYIHARVFHKECSFKKHLYQKTNSIGIDADCFKNYIVNNTNIIRVFDRDSDSLWEVRTALFNNMKEYLHFKPHRAQVFLPLKHFTKIK